MCLRFPTPSRKLNCSLFLLITILLLHCTVAAQDPRKTQDEATRLMGECLQLVQEGLPASLTKAIEKCESARALFHSLNFPAGEGAVLMMTGFAYSQLDQDQKAIETYEQSASLFRAANFPKGEAASLLHLGLMHGKLGEWQKAMDSFDKALPLFRASGEPE